LADSIFLMNDDQQLIEMLEKPYDSEDMLLELLAKFPHLLAGSQINAAVPRRWLLIAREMALPSEQMAMIVGRSTTSFSIRRQSRRWSKYD
jgi:hypothetical protein